MYLEFTSHNPKIFSIGSWDDPDPVPQSGGSRIQDWAMQKLVNSKFHG